MRATPNNSFRRASFRAAVAALAVFIAAAGAAEPAAAGGSSSSGSSSSSANVNTVHPLASHWGTAGNSYPIVFLHGLMGWGESVVANYWGGITTNLLTVLSNAGYTVHAPHMGPVSSNWERACEAYAQIKGTKVDYGLARAKTFGHARFGEDFSSVAYYPAWGTCADCKVHLVGHSMGGPTLRMLAHLMRYGSQDEINACTAAGVACSPLFYTNKTSSYISGAFSLAGVHQGSTFDDYLQSKSLLKDFVVDLIKLLIALDSNTSVDDLVSLWDFQLGHWGLDPQTGESATAYVARVFENTAYIASRSNAFFDLSVAGFRDPLLSFVRNSDDTTYFSLAGLTTFNLLGYSYALPTTDIFLIPFADIIGTYSNTSLSITGGDWRPNDGLVPLISARSDASNSYTSYGLDITGSTSSLASTSLAYPTKGKFNYVGAISGIDHLSITGLSDLSAGKRNQMFLNIAGVLASL
ncbi:hypothetical protein HK405_005163 [Cladochytrium tenue]|nr:hypothetical protein HK405_005163 [Cladochytrium tenue]